MQIYAYDTIQAKKMKIARTPEQDLKWRGWDGIVLGEVDQSGIIRFTAEKIVIDIYNLPKHINPILA